MSTPSSSASYRILVLANASEHSHAAITHAAGLCERIGAGAQLEVAHIIALNPSGSPSLPALGHLDRAGNFDIEREAEEIIAKLGETMKNYDNKIQYKITSHRYEGESTQGLVSYIGTAKPDLVVIGSKGLEGVKRFFSGSHSDYVVRNAKCPVTVVKISKD